MRIELEKALAKMPSLKSNIEEMRASLWQGSIRKTNHRTWFKYARTRFLGWYKKSRGIN